MRPLDLLNAPLQDLNLIEASAGTGKTFTITGLFIRLVVETGLPVEQILVVTYTRAATAELRDRIRRRLVEVRSALDRGVGEDPLTQGLLQRCDDRVLAVRRLTRAILGFDRAAVFTIHGFCQRVLADGAFESGMPFETEMMTDQGELLQQVVDDFWRLHIQDSSPGLAGYLSNNGFTPDLLTQRLTGKLGKPYLQVRACAEPEDLEEIETAYGACYLKVRDLWEESGPQVGDLLLQHPGLNRNRYRPASVTGWLQLMDLFLADPPGDWFEAFGKFTPTVIEQAMKKQAEAPEHPFFLACEQLLTLHTKREEAYRQSAVSMQEKLLEYTERELRERKARLRLQYYDDLLLNLHDALAGERGGALAQAIRSQYAAALIDEFQDTDPIQYSIFRRIYGDTGLPVFLVGDPKQAIYSFRGADIFSYLEAREEAAAGFNLDTNWRSIPELLAGINNLFGTGHDGFFFPQIPYVPISAADQPRAGFEDASGVSGAMRIRFLEGGLSKEQAQDRAVASTAAEIARLLHPGQARIGDRPLAGGDIAVLVRTHRQGIRIKEALLTLGIHGVQHSQLSVFQTREAVELERLLSAVAEPSRESLVRAASTTSLMGFDGNDLETLSNDEEQLGGLLEAYQHYHGLWRDTGFIGMFRKLVDRQSVAARLLAYPDGERRLTNLLHLGELLHRREREGRPGMEGLIKWLSQHRLGSSLDQEEFQLRLESDRELVQIVTIHKSKGLQYPVVFCPFAWDAGVRRVQAGFPYSFHDPEQAFQPVLELGSPRWEEDLAYLRREEMAENLRLLYVALTRAQYRCYLYWGNVNGAGRSALAWLLHPPPDPAAADALDRLEPAFKKLEEEDLLRRVGQLAEDAAGGIQVERCAEADLPANQYQAPEQNTISEETLRARVLTRTLTRTRRVTSFSALTPHRAATEMPDYDATSESAAQTFDPDLRNIAGFPRGTRAGSCLHAIFERLDFTAIDAETLHHLVREQLNGHGIDTEWCEVVSNMVRRVLATELEAKSGIRLEAVSPRQRLVELGFYYPLASVSADGLSQRLLAHGFGFGSRVGEAVRGLSFSTVRGYMRGFIDLIFETDGRFYILDYKSNWLGGRAEDYDGEQLDRAMAREGYFLQYLLYTLALHRYLRHRLPDYDYDRHFGAVFYLFLRGMDPDTGARRGVYRDRPDKALIEALDAYLDDNGKPLP